MKKILALMLALAMVFTLAACGGTKENPTEPDETVTDEITTEEATEPVATEPVSGEGTSTDATEPVTDENGQTVTEAASETTTEAGKGLNSTDAAEIVAYYNAARKATEGHAPKGHQTMTLAALDGGDGIVGGIISAFEGIAKSALEKNSTETDYIPAHDHDDVKVSDVKNAKAVNDGKYTTITFDVVDQSAGASTKGGDGSVGRTVGVLDGIDNALKELSGVEVKDGIQNIKLTYKNAKVTAKIDNETGRIVGGTWQYRVNINISSISLKVTIFSATLKNVSGAVDYKVVI
ncbi:MAG: hypothetical protein II702_00335 [Clostridia bacterium]|nr:hypothetical protein [Clostridia bacterium]